MQELSGFVRAREAAKALGIGLSTWWLRVQRGEYPKGIKLSARTTVWKVADIQALIERLAVAGAPLAKSAQGSKIKPAHPDEKELVEWLRERACVFGVFSVSVSEVLQTGPRKFRKAEALNSALASLAESNDVCIYTEGKRRMIAMRKEKARKTP